MFNNLIFISFPFVLFSSLLRCAPVDQVRSLLLNKFTGVFLSQIMNSSLVNIYHTEKYAGFVEASTHTVCVLTRFCGVFCSSWCCIIFEDDTTF